MSFKKVVEDFVCEHCQKHVKGNGFTNHCPFCLWSKHVDIDPGDRAQKCGGMMEPWEVDATKPDYRVVHRCVVCGYTRTSPLLASDDFDVALAVARQSAKRKTENKE